MTKLSTNWDLPEAPVALFIFSAASSRHDRDSKSQAGSRHLLLQKDGHTATFTSLNVHSDRSWTLRARKASNLHLWYRNDPPMITFQLVHTFCKGQAPNRNCNDTERLDPPAHQGADSFTTAAKHYVLKQMITFYTAIHFERVELFYPLDQSFKIAMQHNTVSILHETRFSQLMR